MDTTTETPTTANPPPEAGELADPAAPPRSRRIHRDPRDRVLGGVAAGIAEHFSIDPVLVRLGFVVTAFLGGTGVFAYLVAWIAIPNGPAPIEPLPRRDHRQLLGYGLVALGLAVLAGPLGLDWNGAAFWPIALIAVGGAVLWLRTRDSQDGMPTEEIVDPAPPPSPPSPPAAPSMTLAPAGSVEAAEHPARPRRARRAPKLPRQRSHLTAITLSALLAVVGGAWLFDLAGLIAVDVGEMFAIALAVVGAGLVASAWFGRARGLIVSGILLSLIVGAFGVIDVPLRGGLGDTTYRARSVTDIETTYEMAFGRLTVDVGDVDFSGHRRALTATLGVGKLAVIVPDDVRVVVDGHAGVGSVNAFDRRSADCCPVDVSTVRTGDLGGGTLRLTVEVGVGDVEIKTKEDTRGTS